MMRYAAVVVFASLLAVAQAAPAPDPITIKFKSNNEGETVVVSSTITEKHTAKYSDGKMMLDLAEDTTTVQEYKETVLKRDGMKPATKLEREYTQGHKKDNKKDTTTDFELNGKTVVIDKKDDAYQFAFKNGKEVTAPALEALTRDFTGRQDNFAELQGLLAPKKGVQLGDEWKLDIAELEKEFDKDDHAVLDQTKTTGTGKLLKVYTKDGKQFGEMHFKIDATIKSTGLEASAVKFPKGAKCVIDITLDVCIDGTAAVGTMKTKGTFSGTGSIANTPDSSLTIDVSTEAVRTQQEPTKK
jgi:hypothetical protein